MSSLTERADRPIAVGDLVQVVRTEFCDCYLGSVFPVIGFKYFSESQSQCRRCGLVWNEPSRNNAKLKGREHDGYLALSWLKRIPPLDELESTRTDEPMKEPA